MGVDSVGGVFMNFKRKCKEHGISYRAFCNFFNRRGLKLREVSDFEWFINFFNNRKKRASQLCRKFDINYTSFRKWTHAYKGVLISNMDNEELMQYVDEYSAIQERKKRLSEYRKQGVNVEYFSKWCKANYGLTVSDIDVSEYDRLVEEYKQVRKV